MTSIDNKIRVTIIAEPLTIAYLILTAGKTANIFLKEMISYSIILRLLYGLLVSKLLELNIDTPADSTT